MYTNLRHHLFAIQAVAAGMIGPGGGSIRIVVGRPLAASRPILRQRPLTRTLARDPGGHRIRVYPVVPGWIISKRQRDWWVI